MKRWLSRLGISLLFAALFAPVAMAANAFDMYSDPSCGCCGAWVDYMRAQGYTVTVHQDQPMAAVKAAGRWVRPAWKWTRPNGMTCC